jgi:hypothetical protein
MKRIETARAALPRLPGDRQDFSYASRYELRAIPARVRIILMVEAFK